MSGGPECKSALELLSMLTTRPPFIAVFHGFMRHNYGVSNWLWSLYHCSAWAATSDVATSMPLTGRVHLQVMTGWVRCCTCCFGGVRNTPHKPCAPAFTTRAECSEVQPKTIHTKGQIRPETTYSLIFVGEVCEELRDVLWAVDTLHHGALSSSGTLDHAE